MNFTLGRYGSVISAPRAPKEKVNKTVLALKTQPEKIFELLDCQKFYQRES